MGRYKGASVQSVRAAVRAKPGVEERMMAALDPESRRLWQSFLATDWLDVQVATRFFVTAAPLLYPADPAPVRRLGREAADAHLTGVYRFVVGMLTINQVLRQSASLWSRYHDTGNARTEHGSERSALLLVRDYPDLPERMRENIAGYVARTMELAGATNVRVVKGDEPREWVWSITWR